MINSVVLAAETIPVEYLDIVSKVDSFYNSAWTKLIIIIGGFFSVLTVLGPLYINWYQKKHANYEQEKIEKNLENYIDDKFEEKQSEFDKKFHRNIAMTMHVQGNAIMDKDQHAAINCYFDAVNDYLKANDSQNIHRVLNIINNYITDKNTKPKDINKIETFFNISVIDLVKNVSEETDNHSVILNKLRYNYKQKME